MCGKRWIAAALTMALSAGLIGCGGQSATEPQPQTQEPTAQTERKTPQAVSNASAMTATDYAKAVSVVSRVMRKFVCSPGE